MKTASNEEAILAALTGMVAQYLGSPSSDELDTQCMSAGQNAIEVLADHGLVEILDKDLRGARWTEAGKQFLGSN